MKRTMLIEVLGVALIATAAYGLPTDTAPQQTQASGVLSYLESFENGSPSPAQCTSWEAYQATLTPNSYVRATIKGSLDPTGVSCTDPAVVDALANALNTNTPIGPLACDGRNWQVGACGPGMELSAAGSICSCPANEYIVRPCIGNLNWGGVNSNTCNGPDQRMWVEFEFKDQGEGACCLPDGSCVETDGRTCTGRGGTFFPDRSCDQVECKAPTGACCLEDGSCKDAVTERDCKDGGGIEWHVGLGCDEVKCRQEEEHCVYKTKKIKQKKCFDSGCPFERIDCSHVTQQTCDNLKDCRRKIKQTSTCRNPNEKGKCKHVLARCDCA